MSCSLLAIKFQEGKRSFHGGPHKPWWPRERKEVTGGKGETPQPGVGCCWGVFFGRQDNGLHTLTVCSSGAKGAESWEQRDEASLLLQPRCCRKPGLCCGDGGCLRHLRVWAAWKGAWSRSQPLVMDGRVLRQERGRRWHRLGQSQACSWESTSHNGPAGSSFIPVTRAVCSAMATQCSSASVSPVRDGWMMDGKTVWWTGQPYNGWHNRSFVSQQLVAGAGGLFRAGAGSCFGLG